MDGILDSVAGLPMHPLIVHGAVVLVPLAALGLMLMAVRPAFSRRFGVLVVIVAGAGAVASVAAKLSGEELAERVGTPEVHAELGDVMPLVALGLFVLGLVFWLVDRGIPEQQAPSRLDGGVRDPAAPRVRLRDPLDHPRRPFGG